MARGGVMKKCVFVFCAGLLWWAGGSAFEPALAQAQAWPTVRLAELPQLLKDQWQGVAPEMTETSRCAAAFDAGGDPSRMILKCSVHIRSAAEGARRAMRYCEDERQKLGLKAACRVVQR